MIAQDSDNEDYDNNWCPSYLVTSCLLSERLSQQVTSTFSVTRHHIALHNCQCGMSPFCSAWSYLVLLQAAKSVSDGYHRNLSTALADMYQKHMGSFLAGLIHKLCGTNLDLITLLQAHQEWTANRPADTTMLKSFVSLCETRTVAELPTLMSQVNIISVCADGDYKSFRPAHEFPLFAQVNGTLSNLKVCLYQALLCGMSHAVLKLQRLFCEPVPLLYMSFLLTIKSWQAN